jgi:hypothetical protein
MHRKHIKGGSGDSTAAVSGMRAEQCGASVDLAITVRCSAPRWLNTEVSSVRQRPEPGRCVKLRAISPCSSGSRHASATAALAATWREHVMISPDHVLIMR